MSIPSFPTLVTRSGKGSPLLDSELDANWTNIRSYCLTLANLISASLNPDGTLVAASVGSQALQTAAVALTNLSPSLLYSIIPVDTDTGTLNAYAITARGGLNGTNLIPGAATYDANGNYVLSGLTLNSGYVFTKNGHDASMINGSQTITATGAQTFIAATTSVTLTGTAGATVTSTLTPAAAISAYKDSQIFFIYTTNPNTAAATLNVNGLGAIPILQNGSPLTSGAIGAPTVFSVIYKNGTFVLLAGGSSSSGSGSGNTTLSYTVNGTNRFTSGGIAIPTSASTLNIAHGLQQLPSTTRVYLLKTASDSSDSVVAVGAYVPFDLFYTASSLATGSPWLCFSIDAVYVNLTTSASSSLFLTGVSTALTPANWQIVVVADTTSNVSNIILPAVTYPFPGPELAVSYGNNLIVSNLGISGYRPFSCVNLATNAATPLSYPDNASVPADCNAAVFARSSGSIEALFTSTAGYFRLPMVSPLISIVPAYSVYNSSGIYTLTVTVSTTYTYAAGGNDTSWSLDGTTYNTTTTITTSSTQTTLYLKGKIGYLVTASVIASGAIWRANRLGTPNYYTTKPVWLTESAGAITNIYSVDSNYNSAIGLNAVRMFNFSVSGNSTAQVTGTVDLTTSTISNIGDFRKWYGTAIGPSGTASNVGTRILFFQYNPVIQRIYVSAGDVPFIHIFKITGTYATGIVGWWADAAKYTNLQYVKSIALGGDGAPWADYGRCNLTIEYDLSTGSAGTEKAIVFTRWGSSVTGTVGRIPWVEA